MFKAEVVELLLKDFNSGGHIVISFDKDRTTVTASFEKEYIQDVIDRTAKWTERNYLLNDIEVFCAVSSRKVIAHCSFSLAKIHSIDTIEEAVKCIIRDALIKFL